MAQQPVNNLVRVVALCPQRLVDQLEALVAETRRDEPAATRSTIVRTLLWEALRARKVTTSAVQAVN